MAMKILTPISLLFATVALAQPPVAPTNEPVGSPRGDNFENYNIVQSFELGYRFATTGGDFDMYRSTVNYTDGIRLLSSSLSIQSREGHGRWFDQIQINTQGLGNDPYEFASVRVEKNGLYRYDMIWRENDYFNPALTIANGEHFKNTTRTMQDHDLTLFPQSNFRLFMGFSRNVDDGPSLSTVQLFDLHGDEYPIFANIHEQQTEYRLGGEARFLGFRLNVMHGWEDFKQDNPTQIFSPETGNNVTDLNTLSSFQSSFPYHGTSPYWRVGLFREGKRLWAVNGRFSYVSGQRGFIDNELASGTNVLGALTTQQILSSGNARRPALAANLNVSLFPTSFMTVSNQTTVNDIRTVGDSVYSQFTLGQPIQPVIPYTYLGIRTVANSTNIELRIRKWFAVHTGYEYSDRRIAVIDGQENFGAPAPAPPDNTPITQSNHLNAGTLGLRFKPIKPLTILLDGEIGRNNAPYTPVSDKNYQVFRARAEYKQKSYRIAAYAKTDYNSNSISLTSYVSRSRNYGADFSWTPNEWFAIDAGYNKLHLDSLGGINFFLIPQGAFLPQDTFGTSYYVSNIHTANLGARFAIGKRADLYVGYSHVQDTGDGRATSTATAVTEPLLALQAVQTFPLKFLSPQARLSIRLNRLMRWNVGYQYYGYNEQFSNLQDFHAHTGYSSVSWAF
jgi:hypothetical protein